MGRASSVIFAVVLFFTRLALATSVQAPAGGAAFAVPGGKVVCGNVAAPWTVEAGGTRIRPCAAVDLDGTRLYWQTKEGTGGDTCTSAEQSCSFSVPRTLPADSTQVTFWLLPAGGRLSTDTYDAAGLVFGPSVTVGNIGVDL